MRVFGVVAVGVVVASAGGWEVDERLSRFEGVPGKREENAEFFEEEEVNKLLMFLLFSVMIGESICSFSSSWMISWMSWFGDFFGFGEISSSSYSSSSIIPDAFRFRKRELDFGGAIITGGYAVVCWLETGGGGVNDVVEVSAATVVGVSVGTGGVDVVVVVVVVVGVFGAAAVDAAVVADGGGLKPVELFLFARFAFIPLVISDRVAGFFGGSSFDCCVAGSVVDCGGLRVVAEAAAGEVVDYVPEGESTE